MPSAGGEEPPWVDRSPRSLAGLAYVRQEISESFAPDWICSWASSARLSSVEGRQGGEDERRRGGGRGRSTGRGSGQQRAGRRRQEPHEQRVVILQLGSPRGRPVAVAGHDNTAVPQEGDASGRQALGGIQLGREGTDLEPTRTNAESGVPLEFRRTTSTSEGSAPTEYPPSPEFRFSTTWPRSTLPSIGADRQYPPLSSSQDLGGEHARAYQEAVR